MPRPLDIAGHKYGRLTANAKLRSSKHGSVWECVCECGNVIATTVGRLRSGNTKSCGCLQKEKARAARIREARHGMSLSPTYYSWKSMVARCTNPNATDFHLYGGRGVDICERWMLFDNFFADMGHRPEGMTLDRIDPDGDYGPLNCRWATHRQQASNKRTSLLITHQGITACAAEWARRLGIPPGRLVNRLRAGWPADRALTEPPRIVRRKERESV